MNSYGKNGPFLGSFAILAIYAVTMGVSVVTPATAAFASHFTNNDVSWISTIPTLFVLIGSLLAGRLAGNVMKYRTLTILGSLLFFIGGCGPALFDNFVLTLVCRGIFGLGLGFLFPLGSALILGLYEGKKQASMLGYGTLFMNAGGIIMQLLGGFLTTISWNTVFWGHAFGLIALVMAFFLPEPEKQVEKESETTKSKLGAIIWVLAGLFLLFNILQYPTLIFTSVLFEARGAGSASAAGVALSFNTIAGCLAGFVFGKLFGAAKRWCLPGGYAFAAIGALCVYVGQNGFIMTLGLILIGFGWNIIIPSIITWAGMKVEPQAIPRATAFLMAMFNIGVFVSSFWLRLLNVIFNENVYSAILSQIIECALLAIIFAVYNPFKKSPQQ